MSAPNLTELRPARCGKLSGLVEVLPNTPFQAATEAWTSAAQSRTSRGSRRRSICCAMLTPMSPRKEPRRLAAGAGG